jgi:cytohesin
MKITHTIVGRFDNPAGRRHALIVVAAVFALACTSVSCRSKPASAVKTAEPPAYLENLALHKAIREGDLAKVKARLQIHPDLIRSRYLGTEDGGASPLYVAATWNQPEVAAFLLEQGADVNAKTDSGNTPMFIAASEDNWNIAVLLLANKADVNARNTDGETPLHWSAIGDGKAVAKLLLAANADVNASNKNRTTPLHEAASWGHWNVADLLLAHKAAVNPKDVDGKTPLKLAEEYRHQDVIDLLRRHGGHD